MAGSSYAARVAQAALAKCQFHGVMPGWPYHGCRIGAVRHQHRRVRQHPHGSGNWGEVDHVCSEAWLHAAQAGSWAAALASWTKKGWRACRDAPSLEQCLHGGRRAAAGVSLAGQEKDGQD